MDVISAILEKIRLSSTIYFKSDFSAPWGMDIPNGPYAQFHLISEGRCTLVNGGDKTTLLAGDIVIFPKGTAHWLADNVSSERIKGREVVSAIIKGESVFKGTDFATSLICGHFEFDRSFEHPFISELPQRIYISNQEQKDLPWLRSICDLIIKETSQSHHGSDVLINRLGEILFIHAIRAYMLNNIKNPGFLAAVQDPKIGRALKAIHTDPARAWQLGTLAQVSGMSRTGFCNQFKALVGKTVMNYITNWRIIEAKGLLAGSKKSVGEIAESVGYGSEAAFNRVFSKHVMLTPLRYRKSVITAS